LATAEERPPENIVSRVQPRSEPATSL